MKKFTFLAGLVIVTIGAQGMINFPDKGASPCDSKCTPIRKIWNQNFRYDSKRLRFICRDKRRERLIIARMRALILDERLRDMEHQHEFSDKNARNFVYPNSAQLLEKSLKEEKVRKSDSSLIQESKNPDEAKVVESVSNLIEKRENTVKEQNRNVIQTRSRKSYKRFRKEDFEENINKKIRAKSRNSCNKQKKEDSKKNINKKKTIDYKGLVREIVNLKKVSKEISKKKRENLCKKYGGITYCHCLRCENAVTNWLNLSENDRNIFIKKIRNPKKEIKTIGGKLLDVDVLIKLINGGEISEKDFSGKKDYATLSTHRMNAKVWKILIESDMKIDSKGRK